MAEANDIDEEHTISNVTFSSLGLDEWLVNALAAMSIQRPTPIQSACIRPILEGTSYPLKHFVNERTRLRRRSQDRIWQNNSICSPDTAKMVPGSIRDICSSPQPDKRTRNADCRPVSCTRSIRFTQINHCPRRNVATHSGHLSISSATYCCCYAGKVGRFNHVVFGRGFNRGF